MARYIEAEAVALLVSREPKSLFPWWEVRGTTLHLLLSSGLAFFLIIATVPDSFPSGFLLQPW